ncbi:hypothetical protein [Corynebacterium sp. H130]|uniref:hypothetical protein n=1 Tax=Corynebacterium sp. H130 TaxID=3133444 RepID=UPI00309E8CCA
MVFVATAIAWAVFLASAIFSAHAIYKIHKAWQEEYRVGRQYFATPTLSPLAVAILSGGRSHVIALSLYLQSQYRPAPMAAAIIHLARIRNADSFEWRRDRFPDLDHALQELEAAKLWATSSSSVSPALAAAHKQFRNGIIAYCTCAVLITLLTGFSAYQWARPELDIESSKDTAAVFAFLAMTMSIASLFVIFRFETTIQQQRKTLPCLHIEGSLTGSGFHFAQRMRNEFGPTSAEAFKAAIYGPQFLAQHYPHLASVHHWMYEETLRADKNRSV